MDFNKENFEGLLSKDLEVTREDLQEFVEELEENRNERIIKLSQARPAIFADLPETEKLIILIDIVGFSKSNTRDQVYKIYLFQRYLETQLLNTKIAPISNRIRIRHFVPTGDGCYIIADKCNSDVALNFLINLIQRLKYLRTDDDMPEFSLRASALIGSCVPFIDMSRHKNYIGEGMNEAARILSYGQQYFEEKNKDKVSTKDELKQYSRNCLYLGDSLCDAIDQFIDETILYTKLSDVKDKHEKVRDVHVLKIIEEE